MTIDEKREALIKYETEWAVENMTDQDFAFIWKHGFKGFDNYTDEEIERDYKTTFFDWVIPDSILWSAIWLSFDNLNQRGSYYEIKFTWKRIS